MSGSVDRSQAEKTASNRAKLRKVCNDADVPVDYLCLISHNMRAKLVRCLNADEYSRARALLCKWYANEECEVERRSRMLRLMRRDRPERQRAEAEPERATQVNNDSSRPFWMQLWQCVDPLQRR